MGPGMRRIMSVAKPNRRNHLLDDLKQILFCPLPDLSGRQGSGRVGEEDEADAILNLGLPDQRLKLIREIYHLFQTAGADAKHFSHSTLSTFPDVYGIRNHRQD